MAQAISPELTALLVDKLQAGPSGGFRGEVEIDWVRPATPATLVQWAAGTWSLVIGATVTLPAPPTPGNLLVLVTARPNGAGDLTGVTNGSVVVPFTAFTTGVSIRMGDVAGPDGLAVGYRIADGSEQTLHGNNKTKMVVYEFANFGSPATYSVSSLTNQSGATKTLPALSPPGDIQLAAFIVDEGTPPTETPGTGYAQDDQDAYTIGGHPELLVERGTAGATPSESGVNANWAGIAVAIGTGTGSGPSIQTVTYQATSLALDRSRGMQAAQLDISLSNEAGDKGYYTEVDPVFVPNNPVRAFAWYGDRANRVRVFTGLFDRVHESRDPKLLEVTCRSRMKWLLEQSFVAIGSQSASDPAAIRTEANGVYVGKSPEYIVGDILTRAGWPSGDRDLATSGVTINEYDLADGNSWADQIAGANRLTDALAWDFWEDETGVVHYGPNALADLTEPAADYTFTVGVDVMHLDHETDDVDRKTRVRVSGPMTSAVPSWSEEWATTILMHPSGAMYVDAEPGFIYVVNRLTEGASLGNYLYKIDQSTRAVVAKWNLGAGLSYQALGISKDPTDATVFWILDGNWRTLVNNHARAVKFSMSTKAQIAAYSLPDGQWTDLKTDGTNLWLTNYGDDKLYKRTMTAGAVASYSYAGHTNPTGLWIDGATIGLVFNGQPSFYKVATSAPGTITGTQSTSGTWIENGDIDTTTHVDLYVVNDKGDFGSPTGRVGKFLLATLVTADVVKWAYDQALEDALGFQSGIANRIHDLHSGDPAHPFEIRVGTYSMNVVNSEAQAQATANAQLVLLERLRRVMDLATIGEPSLQVDDVIRYIDPVAGIDARWLVDSYRASLDGAGTYTQTFSVLPWVAR